MKARRLKLPERLIANIEPCWDLDPKNFNHVHNGQDDFDYDLDEIVILSSDPTDVVTMNCNPMLKGSGDTEKFQVIARQWERRMPLTPPMILVHDGSVVITGGNHRLNMAHQMGVSAIPVIARSCDVGEISRRLKREIEPWPDRDHREAGLD